MPNTREKWIPVTERLPEDNTAVLTHSNFGIQIYWYDKDGFSEFIWGLPCPRDGVTHWMPLPEPPKGE